MQARSSNWQSSGLQIRGLGVRIPPGLPFSFSPSVNLLADVMKGQPLGVSSLSLFKRVSKFLRDVRAELRKVVWPSRRETMVYTTVVLVSVAIVASIIWVADTTFGGAIRFIIAR